MSNPQFLSSRSALAAAALSIAFLASPAQAQQQLVVGMFGGSFADDSKLCHIQSFEKKTGAKVVLKLGNSAQFAAAVRATRGNSDFDVVYLDNSLATQLKNEKLLNLIDRSKLSNAKDVAANAFDKDNQYVVFMIGGTVLVYDTNKIKTPPTSWDDLSRPEYKGKLAIGDISGTAGLQFLLALNKAKGGTLTNLDPGLQAIRPIAKNAVTLYTQADQVVSLVERGEISIAAWYPDRAGSAIDKGLPLAVAYPKEGAVGIMPALAVPKGSKMQDLATQYIDEVLSKEGQACFAERKYAGPVNTQVQLSPKVSQIVPHGATFDAMWFPDPEAVTKGLPQWTKRWQREVVH